MRSRRQFLFNAAQLSGSLMLAGSARAIMALLSNPLRRSRTEEEHPCVAIDA